MVINVNDCVKVKLTDKGKDIYFHRFDSLNQKANGREMIKPCYPEVDEEGYTKMQLWEVMATFGLYLHMGFDTPFETNIILVDK